MVSCWKPSWNNSRCAGGVFRNCAWRWSKWVLARLLSPAGINTARHRRTLTELFRLKRASCKTGTGTGTGTGLGASNRISVVAKVETARDMSNDMGSYMDTGAATATATATATAIAGLQAAGLGSGRRIVSTLSALM